LLKLARDVVAAEREIRADAEEDRAMTALTELFATFATTTRHHRRARRQ